LKASHHIGNYVIMIASLRYSDDISAETNAQSLCAKRRQGDYKWCERLHEFIGKKVTATQKLKFTPL